MLLFPCVPPLDDCICVNPCDLHTSSTRTSHRGPRCADVCVCVCVDCRVMWSADRCVASWKSISCRPTNTSQPCWYRSGFDGGRCCLALWLFCEGWLYGSAYFRSVLIIRLRRRGVGRIGYCTRDGVLARAAFRASRSDIDERAG